MDFPKFMEYVVFSFKRIFQPPARESFYESSIVAHAPNGGETTSCPGRFFQLDVFVEGDLDFFRPEENGNNFPAPWT
jgi:hypothetical protein